MMMVMISIKHSVGLWADMRLQSICLYLSIFNWTPDLSSYAIYNPPLHLIASYSQIYRFLVYDRCRDFVWLSHDY